MQSGSFAFLNIKGESKTKEQKQEKNPATMLKPQFSVHSSSQSSPLLISYLEVYTFFP